MMKKIGLVLVLIYGVSFASPTDVSDNSEGSPKVIMVKSSTPQNKGTINKTSKKPSKPHKTTKYKKTKKHVHSSKHGSKKHKSTEVHKKTK